MNSPEDAFDQQLSEFHEKLREMAWHQMHVLARVSAERVQQDQEPDGKAVHWLRQVRRFVRRTRRCVAFITRPHPKVVQKPDDDDTLVIEATYTVVTPEATTEQELQEDKRWTP